MSKFVKFVKLASNAILPTMAHDDDAGNDLYSNEQVIVHPNSRRAVSTGITWVPPKPNPGRKYVMIVQSRSGLAFKENVEASNAGVIDQGYRGNICVMLHNHSAVPIRINVGDKIAQGIIYDIPKLAIKEGKTKDLKGTKRGSAGFGSTGKK